MNAAAEENASVKTTKRLTLETPTDVHKAVKNGATDLDSNMLGVTLEMYRARFMGGAWPADIVDQVLDQLVRQADAGEFQWPAAVASSVRSQNADDGK